VVSNTSNSPATITLVGGQWISGYYAAQNGALSASNIPWSKYTHIIHFAAGPAASGNGTVDLLFLTQAEINALIAARPAGKHVLVSIKDNDFQLTALAQNTSPAMIATFVSNIVNFVNTNGYDGVDIDWEQNINVAQYNDLLARLRKAMPAKVITMAAGNWGSMESVALASYAQLDQINVMCYDMDSPAIGYSWYNDGLLQAGNSGVETCDWRIRAFTNAGVPASKIGVGIPYYGRRWTGVTHALVYGNFSTSFVRYRELVADATRWQPQYQFYDSVYKSDYLSIPSLNEFISYNGPQSVKDAVTWQKSQGFGGFMTFTVDHEYLSGQVGDARFPMSTTLCQNVFGTCQ
jgi:chitinase